MESKVKASEQSEQIIHSIIQLIMLFETDKSEVEMVELVKVAAERLLIKTLNHSQLHDRS